MAGLTAGTIEFEVEGMHCAACAESVRQVLLDAGARAVWVDLARSKVVILPGGKVSAEGIRRFREAIERQGYRVRGVGGRGGRRLWKSTYSLVLSLVLTLPLVGMMFLPVSLSVEVQWVLATGVLLIGFVEMGLAAWRSLKRLQPSMEVLILLGASSAYLYSVVQVLYFGRLDDVYFETTGVIITLILAGFWIERKVLQRSQDALFLLLRYLQRPVRVLLPGGGMREVDAFLVEPGVVIVVGQGDLLPVDGEVVQGEAYVDESVLTGESEPVYKRAGDRVHAGSRVLQGGMQVRVRASGEATALARMIQVLEQVRQQKPAIRRLADRISAWFVPVVLLIALGVFVGWVIVGLSVGEALLRAIAVVVIACPCAFGIATPLALSAGVHIGSRRGFFFRSAFFFEYVPRIRKIFFDKTGTLTENRMRIRGYETTLSGEEFRRIVVGLEMYSRHPVARAVVAEWGDVVPASFREVREIPGVGIEGVLEDGRRVQLRRALPGEVPRTFYLVIDGEVCGWLDMEEVVRRGVREVVAWLRARGFEVVMLTGDRRERAERLARQVGIQEVYAECTPEEKLRIIREAERAVRTMMVGDGINDVSALAAATLSCSFASASDLARNAASVVLARRDFYAFQEVLRLAWQTRHIILTNFLWAFSYNVVAIPVAASGLLSPAVAALSMLVSDVMLVLNTLRLYWWARRRMWGGRTG